MGSERVEESSIGQKPESRIAEIAVGLNLVHVANRHQGGVVNNGQAMERGLQALADLSEADLKLVIERLKLS